MLPAFRIVVRRRVLPWFACALALASTPVAAQPLGEVVVLPFGATDLEAEIKATSMLEAELSNEWVSLISLHDARDRFTARSRPPQMASDSDVDVLAREARQAIEHVAFGHTAAAQQSVREVITRAERTLESLNRETATARQILDACLSLVRSALQTEKRELALEQATRCRRLVPDLAPSEVAHPANVVGVLAEADNLLRRMRIGKLTVRSAPETSCSVYLNGRHLGATPFHLDRAAAGDYRVQVECGRTLARVHVVQLGDEPVSLLVDTQFDRAVASDPRLLLRYASEQDARAQAVSHAVRLGREISADDVVLVALTRDRAELLRVNVQQQRLVARVSVPWTERHGFSPTTLERGIRALAEGRIEGEPSVEPVASKPQPPPEEVSDTARGPRGSEAPDASSSAAGPSMERAEEPPSATSGRPRRAVRRAGFALLGVSGALFAVGMGLDARAQKLHDELAELGVSDLPPDPTQQQQFERAQDLRWLGIGGPVLALAATIMVIDARPAVPWWSYAIGSVGLGLIAIGSQQVAVNDKCDVPHDELCYRDHDSAPRGALLLAAAVPFLSVPLIQLARRSETASVTVLPATGPSGAQLSVRATF